MEEAAGKTESKEVVDKVEEGGSGGEENTAETYDGPAFAACGASNRGSGEQYGTEAESRDYEAAGESESKLMRSGNS